MVLNNKYFFFLLVLLGIVGCSKEPSGYVSEMIQLPTSLAATDICFINEDTGFVSVGDQFSEGYLFRTNDGGQTWDSVYRTDYKINSIDYKNGELSFSMSGNRFFRSNDMINWTDNVAYGWWAWHKHLKMSDGRAIFVGGENFGRGFIHIQAATSDSMLVLKDTFEHELRDIEYTSNQTLFVVGYGLIMKSTDDAQTWDVEDINGDFFRGVDFPSVNVGYVIGEYGAVYKTTNHGASWQNIRIANSLFADPNRRYMDIAFWNESTGFLVGTGNMVWRTQDGGETWKELSDLDGWADMNAIRIFNNKAYILGNGGKLLIVSLE